MDEFDIVRDKQSTFRKIYNHIGVISIGLVLSLVLFSLLLNLFGLRFRMWIYYTAISISVLGMLTSAVRWFRKQIPKVKRLIGFTISLLVVLSIIFWQVPMIILLAVAMLCQTEHVVEVNGQKYVAYVESNLLHTSVYYYDYIGPILVGTEAEFDEHYKGSFDPIKRKQEEEQGTLQKELKSNYVEGTNIENENFTINILPEVIDEKDILYKKDIDSTTSIRIVYSGSSLGGKIGIRVQKTNNGGEWWNDKINSADKFMTVNSGAEFVFFNENVRFN